MIGSGGEALRAGEAHCQVLSTNALAPVYAINHAYHHRKPDASDFVIA